MTPIIRESPVLSWAAGQEMAVQVSFTPRSGLTVSDYGTLTLTVREDPEWPREGEAVGEARQADPLNDGWESAASGTATATTSPVSISVTMPSGAGWRRYCVDVVADGGTAGRVQLVSPTWLTVTPTLLTVS